MKNILLGITAIAISFFSYTQDTEGGGRPRQIENKYAIKFTPTQIVMGELNLGAEFKLGKKTSIDLELGPTFSYAAIGGRTEYDFDDTENGLIYEGSIGYFGALGFRYYPFDKTTALTRLYVQPQFKYRLYNSFVDEETGLWEKQTVTNTQYKAFFNVGWVLWASKSFGFDFYLGTGMGYRTLDRYSNTIVYGETVEFKWLKEPSSKPMFLLNFGIKMAIGG